MMFFDHMNILQEAINYSEWPHDYRMNVFYKKFGTPTPKEFDEFFTFKVVRNPYNRAISSFMTFIRNKKIKISFMEYLDYLETNMHILDIHHQKQIDNYKWKKIVKIEELKSSMDEINNNLNTNFKTDYWSNHHHIKLPRSFQFLGKTKFASTPDRVIPHYDDFYNEDLRSKVQKIFYEDFCTYNYPT